HEMEHPAELAGSGAGTMAGMSHGSDHAGHSNHAGHAGHGGHAEIFRQRFWISLVLSIPVVLWSEMVQDWFNYSMPTFTSSDLISPVLGTIIFFYGGWVFLAGGWDELKSRKPGMMLLISLAIVVAWAASLASSFDWVDLEFWWELALLVTVMLLGHWQEMRAIGQAQGALDTLAALLPDEAERVSSGSETETVPVSALSLNDIVLIRPGGRVPADGVVTDGRAELDESMITGESRPVSRTIGDRVVAGTVVAGSAIRVRVDAIGEATALAGIQRLVADAQNSRSNAQVLADRFAALLFYGALGSGAITFIIWSIVGSIDDAISRTVTVLVISCPHALGLAIPLVIAISTAMAARQGILVRDRLALERMRLVDTVLFDKTGTLTEGAHAVREIRSVAPDLDESGLLGLAASVEADSEHPLAKAIVTAARDRALAIPPAHDFSAIAGRGVEAMVGGASIAIGGPGMLRERKLMVPEALVAEETVWEGRGAAVLHVVRNGEVVGALELEDRVRPEAKEAVDELHQARVRVVMITGDAKSVAQAVGDEIGVDEVFAEVLPEDKLSAIATLQKRGAKVAMVGDGVNDAPALAQADAGIAIGAGTDVAIASAGVILATSDPRAVMGIRRLSQASYRKSIQNLVWAAGYNIIAIPLAAGVLAPVGFVLDPAVGALMMSLSTIIVALNAQLLRRVDLRPGAGK
ncbi:MAG TPA: heavy metal translocating P-type ATPase, partial [Thermomicrobiales bacterium]|nr:heavy metal translocating P-type ATPase [Thermomicrobiales bacterium]